MGFLSRILGIVDAEPPKMLPARTLDQFQFPMVPGGASEGIAPWSPEPPQGLHPDLENKLQGVPFSSVLAPSGGDMSASSPSYSAGGPVRGMEPLSAPPGSMPPQQSFVPPPDPALAALLSRSQDQMDWYRRTGEQELSGLREGRDRYTRLTGALERQRRGGTGGGGY